MLTFILKSTVASSKDLSKTTKNVRKKAYNEVSNKIKIGRYKLLEGKNLKNLKIVKSSTKFKVLKAMSLRVVFEAELFLTLQVRLNFTLLK